MAPIATPSEHKDSFLQDNQMFSELELTKESKAIGDIQELDLLDNEIWLLQCPKGMNIKEFESQKLKMPGRTNLNDSEAVSMEFTEGQEQHAFAYCNRKGRYALRLLPVRGTIVLRDRLKAAEIVTPQRIEECCPPSKRVPLPTNIRVRHPLLGYQYEDKLILDKNVTKRLRKADEVSAKILKDNLAKKMEKAVTKLNSPRKSISKTNIECLDVEINSTEDDDDDDAVEFVSEEKPTKKKSKRKNSESALGETSDMKDGSAIKKKSKKSNKDDEIVSKDLQWLQNI